MQRDPYHPRQWNYLIPNIEKVIAKMELTPIIAVGITPFTRIIPSFFLKNFSIYTIHNSSDVQVMRQRATVYTLADKNPKIAKRVHGTGYLIGNFIFQSFLKSRPRNTKLLFYTMTERIVNDLSAAGAEWIGNDPKTFEDVMYKGSFRALIKERGLPTIPSCIYARKDFLGATFSAIYAQLAGPFVVQRADKETGGNEGTFFVHTEEDMLRCQQTLTRDEQFEEVIVTSFIKGHSTSMLGCVLPEGTLSGPLQLQLIDVPEALHGVPANGIFFGNDLGFHPWSEEIETKAQEVVESIGAYLRDHGYKGIFGIDFLYDEERDAIYANECNPRFTGSLVLYSLTMLHQQVPPMEFFHLMAHLNITADFDFDAVNRALKQRMECAHIALSPKGISVMALPLLAGIYEYTQDLYELSYIGPAVSFADFTNERQFMLIDTVPEVGTLFEQSVPRLFKFVFPRSIATSSYGIDETAAFLLNRFSKGMAVAAATFLENKNR